MSGIKTEPAELRSITVGLIGALVADRSGVTSQEALKITRKVVGRYAALPITDEHIQEITLQALYEARSVRATRDAVAEHPESFLLTKP